MKALALIPCGLVLLAACSRGPTLSPASGEKSEPAIKKLLARMDIVLVRHFFSRYSVAEDQNQKYREIYPGAVSLIPVWAYEPEKEKDGQRGAQIKIVEAWLPSSSGGEPSPRSATSFLDLDELKDLDNALAYFDRSDSPWRSSTTAEDIEVGFASKDGFLVTAVRSDDGSGFLLFEAENSSARIPMAKLGTFKASLDAAIALLDSKGV